MPIRSWESPYTQHMPFLVEPLQKLSSSMIFLQDLPLRRSPITHLPKHFLGKRPTILPPIWFVGLFLFDRSPISFSALLVNIDLFSTFVSLVRPFRLCKFPLRPFLRRVRLSAGISSIYADPCTNASHLLRRRLSFTDLGTLIGALATVGLLCFRAESLWPLSHTPSSVCFQVLLN